MPNAAAPRPGEWLPAALAILAGVTAMRVAMLAFDRTDLFVDEAQYWFWGQDLAWGYYSKPPLIGWVIRAATDLGGSDSAFWVRLPAALFHAATGLILAAIAAPRWGARAAVWVAAVYITLPMVAVGSWMISTDTVMFPFLVGALGLWLASLDRGGDPVRATGAGALLGIAFLGKYAAAYYLLCAALAALAIWRGRTTWRTAAAGLVAFALVIAPNIGWNLANGGATFAHTLDNAGWVRDLGGDAALDPVALAVFLASQFAVFGPLLFAALLRLAARWGDGDGERRLLLIFSLPILAIVSAQAFLGGAYANWAAAAYLAGLLAVVPWLLGGGRGWLVASLVLHGAFAVFVPAATVWGTGWRLGAEGPLLLERYLGRRAMSAEILAIAAEEGLPVVADDRDILADLFHAVRDGGPAIHARPVEGRPPNHYVLTRSLPPDTQGAVLLVTRRKAPPEGCDDVSPRARLAPESGAYRERPQTVFVVPASCLAVPG